MKKSIPIEIEENIGEKLKGFIPGCGLVKTASGKTGFLKTGPSSDAYRCEAHGLDELAKSGCIPTAKVMSVGDSHILTEYIPRGIPPADFFSTFGRQLAQMHRFRSDRFGFYENNFIGANPQPNIPAEAEKTDWTAFYFNKRLLFQYKLAEKNGLASAMLKAGFARLESRIESILAGSAEEPSLLHGDLWAGNFLCNDRGEAVLIDPAVYYGHREADLAMTKLFGGFAPAFYTAYQAEYPLPEGWDFRENIYRLYHILNHLNLFGRSYLSEAEYIIETYTR